MFVEHKEQGERSREPQVKPLADWQKLLLAGADRIERLGWCQFSYGSAEGAACLRGSVYKAAFALGLPTKEAYEALERVDDALPSGQWSMAWNDAKGRTKEEVVAKLRAVALGE